MNKLENVEQLLKDVPISYKDALLSTPGTPPTVHRSTWGYHPPETVILLSLLYLLENGHHSKNPKLDELIQKLIKEIKRNE